VTQTLAQDQEPAMPASDYELIIRTDDIGFCHAVNMAIEKILEEGMVTSVSVMTVGPWLDEGVEILKKHPEVSVGVHLALNCEWKELRWGPVSPASEVPSLVDAYGKFFPTRANLMDHRPNVEEVEKELRAQIDLAFRKGLNVSYVDYHMGAAMSCREFQEVVERLAIEYGIGVMRYFGEQDVKGIYSVPPDEKVTQVVANLKAIEEPGRYMLVVHPGMDVPEMAALTDLNISGLKDMHKHRAAETQMLCDPRFKEAVNARFRLVGHRELKEAGLHKMERPFEAKPYAEVVAEQSLFNPYTMYEVKGTK
jgi:predicted glycoside hydrolase/deacetylase ChbG (UPF0249 family)